MELSGHDYGESQTLKVAGTLNSAVSELTQEAFEASGSKNKSNVAYIGLMGAIGALHVVAALLGETPEGEDKDNPYLRVTKESVLFSAILAAKTVPCSWSTGKIDAEFGPLTIVEALNDFEKMMGYKADPFLDPRMIQQCREAADNGSAEAEKRMARAASQYGSSRTLQ